MNGFTSKIANINFLSVPSGNFMMSANKWELPAPLKHELPKHKVNLNHFYMSETVITIKQWLSVIKSLPIGIPLSYANDNPNYPVYHVSHKDAAKFIKKLNESESEKNYRLPTEAEWEYACRAGTDTTYYWGSAMDENMCWNNYNVKNKLPKPVKLKPPNQFGFYDMIGNVSEIVSDWYAPNYYKTSPINNPKGASNGKHKIVKGSCFNLYDLPSWRRLSCSPKSSNSAFRIVSVF